MKKPTEELMNIGQCVSFDNKEWVIISAEWAGGGSDWGHTTSRYPDGWQLSLAQIVDGEVRTDLCIRKYQLNTGCFNEESYLTNFTLLNKKYKKIISYELIK